MGELPIMVIFIVILLATFGLNLNIKENLKAFFLFFINLFHKYVFTNGFFQKTFHETIRLAFYFITTCYQRFYLPDMYIPPYLRTSLDYHEEAF